jgi:hypothetical protein
VVAALLAVSFDAWCLPSFALSRGRGRLVASSAGSLKMSRKKLGVEVLLPVEG